MAVQSSKKLMRKQLKDVLKSLSQETKDEQSATITKKVLTNPIYQKSEKIGVYLSTPEEVDTDAIVRDILSSGKECYVPRCTKQTMFMERLASLEDYDNLPSNRLGIREPLAEDLRESSAAHGLHLILVPGLGFTSKGHRLGRGKGYYDAFLSEMRARHSALNFTTIGVGFREQIVEDLPVNESDYTLDSIISG